MLPVILVIVALILVIVALIFKSNSNKSDTTKSSAEDIADTNERPGTFMILDRRQLPKLKKTHDAIENAIYSIAPKTRESQSSYPIITADNESLPDVKTKIIKMIERDLKLQNNIPEKLMNTVNDLFDFSAIDGVEEYDEGYFELDLSDKNGGISTIRIGVVGMKKIKQKILIGICLYFEKWEEKEWVKLNLKHSIWSKQNIKDFAKYKLYTEVGRKFELRCSQQLKQLNSHKTDHDDDEKISDDIDKLKAWLTKLNLFQYYHVFKKHGFDDLDTISEIDVSNDTELKKLGINKQGHLIKLKKAITRLNKTDEPVCINEGHQDVQHTNYL